MRIRLHLRGGWVEARIAGGKVFAERGWTGEDWEGSVEAFFGEGDVLSLGLRGWEGIE